MQREHGHPAVCDFCETALGTLENHQAHIAEPHHPASCPRCEAATEFMTELEAHLALEHQHPLNCCVCKTSLRDVNELGEHIALEHDHPVSCTLCRVNLVRGSEEHLEAHLRTEHGDVMCGLCYGLFKTIEEMELHVKLVHECSVCQQRCRSERERDHHLAEVHGKAYELEPMEIPGERLSYLPGRAPTLPPTTDEERCRWLYPLCLELVKTENVGDYLMRLPEQYRDRFEYAVRQVNRIYDCRKNKRYH